MTRGALETPMGALVLLAAKFGQVDALAEGSDVRMSGIKIGRVVDLELEPESYIAIVRMTIDQSIRLPADTTAKIESEGLFGAPYVALEPGGSDETIEPGSEIVYTQDAISLPDLIVRFILNSRRDR